MFNQEEADTHQCVLWTAVYIQYTNTAVLPLSKQMQTVCFNKISKQFQQNICVHGFFSSKVESSEAQELPGQVSTFSIQKNGMF